MTEYTYSPTAKGYAVYAAWLDATAKKHNCTIDEAREILKTQWIAELENDDSDR